jgi:hypothetical protein
MGLTKAERHNRMMDKVFTEWRIHEAKAINDTLRPELHNALCKAQLVAKDIANRSGTPMSDAHKQAAQQINKIIDSLWPETVDATTTEQETAR